MENKQEPQAVAYLFRILDIGGQGRLCSRTLEYFYSAVEKRLLKGDHQPGELPQFGDLLNEIFDMVKPKNPSFITLDDLVDS